MQTKKYKPHKVSIRYLGAKGLTKALYFGKVHTMNTYDQTVLDEEMPEQLAVALSQITDIATMQAFLRDVLTESEIRDIGARLEAAKMLRAGMPYSAITQRTKLSSRTVARISDWLQNGAGGYALALDTIEHHHTLPDSSV